MSSEGGKTYFKQLDGLRFIAVTSVMWGHWGHVAALFQFNIFLRGGGVELFFVLSGFLITRILILSKLQDQNLERTHWHSIKHFYIRRFLRIFPIYYLVVFGMYLINFEESRKLIFSLLTYTVDHRMVINETELGHFAHFWSLSVEEQFYIFFPFVVLFVPKKYLIHALYFFTFFNTVLSWMGFDFSQLGYKGSLPSNVIFLGSGGLLAYYSIFKKEALIKLLQKYWFFLLSLPLYIFLIWLRLTNDISSNLYQLAIFTAPLAISTFCFWLVGYASLIGFKGFFKRFLENKQVVYIGKISYGLYLYHMFMTALSPYLHWQIFLPIALHFHITLPISNNPYILALWYFALTFTIASLSWRFIESPINKLKDRFVYD